MELQGYIKRIIRMEKGERKRLHNSSQLEEKSAAAAEGEFFFVEQVGIIYMKE